MGKGKTSSKNNLLSVDVGISLAPEATVKRQDVRVADMAIQDALEIILRQMKLSGSRPRTMQCYKIDVTAFMQVTGAVKLEDITVENIYKWLGQYEGVKPITLRSRLKTLKAFLGKCNVNGWLPVQFWRSIHIKVDEEEKFGATEKDVKLLLSMLDLTDFVELRDAVAILLMYKAGLRVATLCGLEERHVDLQNGCLNLTPDIMKNHKALKMPINSQICQFLSVLIQTNRKIREHTGDCNQRIFISRRGGEAQSAYNHNVIQQRLRIYAKRWKLENINPHGLRRGFAQNLLRNGATVPLISKALGHSDLAVTTKYLYLSKEEVADSLRDFV